MTKKTQDRALDPKSLAAQVGDYVRGYGRNNAEGLVSLITYRQWPVVAQRELDTRAARFISIFNNDELEAIARGDVNLSEVGREILKEIQGGKA